MLPLLLLPLLGSCSAQVTLTPVEAVPHDAVVLNAAPPPSIEPLLDAEPIFPLPPTGGPLPHPELVELLPDAPKLLPDAPQSAPLIFKDSPVVHPPPPPPPPPHPVEPVPLPRVEEPVYTDQKCRIEQVELVAEVCVPTIVRDCGPVALEARIVTSQESCVDVARTVCTESEEAVDNELCYYTYSEAEIEGETTSVEVEYGLECEDAPSTYGGYGKDESKVCYNKPALSPSKSSIKLEYPKAEKKCENRPVMLPKVNCEEAVVNRCFQLPTSSLETTTLEKCSTKLGPPECRKVDIKLPRQVCSRVLPSPEPVHAAHALHAVHPVLQGHGLPGVGISTGHGFINFSGK